MTTIKSKLTILLSIVLFCGTVNAQNQEEKYLSRGQIYTYLGFSMAANLAQLMDWH